MPINYIKMKDKENKDIIQLIQAVSYGQFE